MEFVENIYELINENCEEPSVVVFVVFTIAVGVYKVVSSYRKSKRNRDFQVERSVKNLFRKKAMDSFSSSRRSSVTRGSRRNESRSAKQDMQSSLLSDSFSADEEDELEVGPNLRFEKLRIGSPEKNNGGWTFPSKSSACCPYSSSSSPTPPIVFNNNNSFCGKTETAPLWKDYPMVEKTVPSGYSYCSSPSSPYPSFAYSSTLSCRHYRSSSTATIFGGPKPLLSPPKLDVGYASSVVSFDGCASPSSMYSCYSGHSGRAWGCSSAGESHLLGPYATSPLSRSSSQSSGFISQKGPGTPPPSSSSNLTSSIHSPFLDGRHPDVFSVYSNPRSQTAPSSRPLSYPGEFVSFSTLSSCRGDNNNERIWPPSAFSATTTTVRPVSMTAGCSLNGNTCSRFARRDSSSDTNLFMKRLIDIRSASSTLYSEDEDDDEDNESFKSAITSLANNMAGRKTQSQHSRSLNSVRYRCSGSSSHSGSNIVRNLRKDMFDESTTSSSGSVKTEKMCAGHTDSTTEEDKSSEANSSVFWPTAQRLFWSVSLFINVLLIFFLVFCGSSTALMESSQEFFYEFSNSLSMSFSTYWNDFREFWLDCFEEKPGPFGIVLHDNDIWEHQ